MARWWGLKRKNSHKSGSPGVVTVFHLGTKNTWTKREQLREWARLSEGCYVLRSNIRDWSAAELWKAYIQLTKAEEAFRIYKTDLGIRPVWHQKEERVRAHILVCFLAYVLWKALGGYVSKRAKVKNSEKRFMSLPK